MIDVLGQFLALALFSKECFGLSLIDFVPVLAGVGLFLVGMSAMGSSLEKIAGARMEQTLGKLASNRISGVLLGTAVTALIQSSAATTVMVVGFVNAGIMQLTQAVSVIMGANIGTTVTGQIIRLSEIGAGSAGWMVLLKPSTFAPILIAAGAVFILFFKKKNMQNLGMLLFGFGALFFGMHLLETTLAPLRESPALANILIQFQNPLLGILLGAAVTIILQSSSASVGLLQALATTGAVSFATMVPIIFGQNIGTCFTVLLASVGANRNAKRAAMIHLLFNVIGTVIFFVLIYGFQLLVGIPFFERPVDMGDIANFHTVFNIGSVILLLPFCNMLIKLANLAIRDKGTGMQTVESLLDERFLDTPSVAINICRDVIVKMGHAASENVELAASLLIDLDHKKLEKLEENETFCDKSESNLSAYLVKITSNQLSEKDSNLISEIFRSVSDFERISDRAVNIVDVAKYNSENGITFTEEGKREIALLQSAIQEILSITVQAYENQDSLLAARVEPFEEVIDILTETIKSRHVHRLQTGACSIQPGISFMELLTNYERIADHCSNLAIYVIQLSAGDADFDRHAHVQKLHEGLADDYKVYYAEYNEKYYVPLSSI